MKVTWKLGLVAVVVGGAMALGACGSDSGPSTDTSLSQSQAAVVGGQVADQAAAIASALSDRQLSTGGLGQGFFAPAAPGGRTLQIVRRVVGPRAAAKLFLVEPPPGCDPGFVGDSTDPDGNGIPTDVTYTFTSGNCSYPTDTTDAGDTITVTVTGIVALRDIHDSDTFFGYDARFVQWKYLVTDGIDTIFVRLNGTVGADVGTSAVSANDHYSFTVAIGADNATISQDVDAGFNPDVGEVIDSTEGATLPPGKFALNGVIGFNGVQQGQSGDWGFTLTTTDSLAFDPACNDPNQLVGGSLRGAITAKSSVGFTVDFQDCGVLPTVTAYDGSVSP